MVSLFFAVWLAWDAVPPVEPPLKYRIYYGTTSGKYESPPKDVGPATTAEVTGLPLGIPIFFVVKAYNDVGESGPSNEVLYVQAAPPPSPSPSPSPSPTAAPTPMPGLLNVGESTILAYGDNGNGNLMVAQKVSLPITAALQSFSFYVTKPAGKLRLGMYDATGPGGGPGNRVAAAAEITPIAGWNKKTLTPVVLPRGTYWLAYFPSSNSLAFRKALSGDAAYYSLRYGQLPAKFSTSPATATVHWSFYVTVQP
jgi:hypothetical protein